MIDEEIEMESSGNYACIICSSTTRQEVSKVSLFKKSVMQDDTEESLLPESDHCEYSADNANFNMAFAQI